MIFDIDEDSRNPKSDPQRQSQRTIHSPHIEERCHITPPLVNLRCAYILESVTSRKSCNRALNPAGTSKTRSSPVIRSIFLVLS